MAMLASRRIVFVLAGAACFFCVAALAGCGGSGVVVKDSACLQSHGWKVERVSSVFFVATRGQEQLNYDSSGVTGFSWRTGSMGPPSNKGQLSFACFPKTTVSWIEGGHSSAATGSSSPSR
jgi:hypothetical protein